MAFYDNVSMGEGERERVLVSDDQARAMLARAIAQKANQALRRQIGFGTSNDRVQAIVERLVQAALQSMGAIDVSRIQSRQELFNRAATIGSQIATQVAPQAQSALQGMQLGGGNGPTAPTTAFTPGTDDSSGFNGLLNATPPSGVGPLVPGGQMPSIPPGTPGFTTPPVDPYDIFNPGEAPQMIGPGAVNPQTGQPTGMPGVGGTMPGSTPPTGSMIPGGQMPGLPPGTPGLTTPPIDPYAGSSPGESVGGNGPSAGPSQGPSLGMVWPNYNGINRNVEQQYAEWREQRRAAGQDPYDMNAFRQHLIGMGAPDPGAPAAVSPNGTAPTPQSAPAPTPTTPPVVPPVTPGATPPVIPSGAQGGTQVPGAVYNPSVRSGSAQQLFGGGLQGAPSADADIERLFPFALDPEGASRNLLRGYGFDLSSGNPFTEFMEGLMPGTIERLRMQQIMGGGSGTDPETMKQISGLGAGAFGSTQVGPEFLTGMRDLQARYRANPTALGENQRRLAERSLDPDQAYGMFQMGQNLAPDLNNAAIQRRMHQTMLDRYRNQAAGKPGLSYLDFLTGAGG